MTINSSSPMKILSLSAIVAACICLSALIGTSLAADPTHNSVGSCLLIPTFTFDPKNPNKGRPSLSNVGRLSLYYDSTNAMEPQLIGTLPSALDSQPRGFHVHMYGDVHSATSQGGHFEGTHASHALPPYAKRHVGDMGNVTETNVNKSGDENLLWSLSASKDTGVIGRAIVLHEKADTGAQPSGNAGSRIFDCVIGISGSRTNNQAVAPSNVTKQAVVEFLPSSGDWFVTHGRMVLKESDSGSVTLKSKMCGLDTSYNYNVEVHQNGDLTGSHVASNVGDKYGSTDMGSFTMSRNLFTYEKTISGTALKDLIGRSVVIRKSSGDKAIVAVGVVGIMNDAINVDSSESDFWMDITCEGSTGSHFGGRLSGGGNAVLFAIVVSILLAFVA